MGLSTSRRTPHHDDHSRGASPRGLTSGVSGRQALATIEQAVARLRDDEAGVARALQAATDDAARLRMQRIEGFRELARLKLDPATGKDILGDIDAAERRALNMLPSAEKH